LEYYIIRSKNKNCKIPHISDHMHSKNLKCFRKYGFVKWCCRIWTSNESRIYLQDNDLSQLMKLDLSGDTEEFALDIRHTAIQVLTQQHFYCYLDFVTSDFIVLYY
jgi:hypothetical protein